jgi:hypothetical protein
MSNVDPYFKNDTRSRTSSIINALHFTEGVKIVDLKSLALNTDTFHAKVVNVKEFDSLNELGDFELSSTSSSNTTFNNQKVIPVSLINKKNDERKI